MAANARIREGRAWMLFAALLLSALTLGLMARPAHAAVHHASPRSDTSEGWSSPATPAGSSGQAPIGLSCVPGFCMSIQPVSSISSPDGQAVTSAEQYSVLTGGSWSAEAPTGFDTGDEYATSLTCASSDLCMAIADHGVLEVYDGSSWSAASIPGGNSGMSASGTGEAFTEVSCAAGTTFCMAAAMGSGETFAYATYDDGTWSVQPMPDFTGAHDQWGIQEPSCSGDGTCIALVTDHTGDYGTSTWSDGSWTQPVAMPFGTALSLECSNLSFCISSDAAAENGLWTFDGQGWNEDTSAAVAAVEGTPACVAGTGDFCVAASREGTEEDDFLADTSSGWAVGPMPATPGERPARIACASSTSCVIASISFSTDKFVGFQVWPSVVNSAGSSASTAAIRGDLGKVLTLSGSSYTTQSIAKHGCSLSFDAPAPGKLTIVWTSGRTKVASLSHVVRAGKSKLKLTLTRAGRRLLLKAKRSLTLRTTATFAPTHGAKVSVAKTVRLHR